LFAAGCCQVEPGAVFDPSGHPHFRGCEISWLIERMFDLTW